MNYYELLFTLITPEDYVQDLMIATLSEAGFDTFEETDFGFKAYIPSQNFNQDEVEALLSPYREQFTFSYEINLLPHKNWNEVWESNFQPIEIANQVRVRATFHDAKPEYPYEIVIDPKMAFGTGHHETTSLMMASLLETEVRGKKVLDMGCGTGILAILAAKLGATDLTAIDYDILCYDSTQENTVLNHVDGVNILCGSKEAIPDEQYDIILANINRNILLDQMERYNEVLKPGGLIFFSGFYETPDLEMISNEAAKYDIRYVSHKKSKEWVATKFKKD